MIFLLIDTKVRVEIMMVKTFVFVLARPARTGRLARMNAYMDEKFNDGFAPQR
jgi:hypothetical protein